MVAYRIDVAVGDTINRRYRVEKRIGSGSYGDVFKVSDTSSGGLAALKLQRLWEVMGELHENLLVRFEQEYRTACIESDYLVHATDHGTIEGNPYLVMEYCAQGDLSALVGKGDNRLPRFAHDILMGLHALHSEGKVHRDLKPENVLIKDCGNAALTDFGIIGDKKHSVSARNFFSRRPKQVFGTYLYMSPEQADRKGGGVTYLPTVDIFSFGVMMYELLTGLYPFGRLESFNDLDVYLENARKERWDRDALRSVSRGADWYPLIERCLMADYSQRYQNVQEVMQDLRPLYQEVASADSLRQRTLSRSPYIKSLVVTQGLNVGHRYIPWQMLQGGSRMLRIGREYDNDIMISEASGTYASRYHATLEFNPDGRYWVIRDGQWRPEQRRWVLSTNGTYVNSTLVNARGLRLYTGDIITVGEAKIKVE